MDAPGEWVTPQVSPSAPRERVNPPASPQAPCSLEGARNLPAPRDFDPRFDSAIRLQGYVNWLQEYLGARIGEDEQLEQVFDQLCILRMEGAGIHTMGRRALGRLFKYLEIFEQEVLAFDHGRPVPSPRGLDGVVAALADLGLDRDLGGDCLHLQVRRLERQVASLERRHELARPARSQLCHRLAGLSQRLSALARGQVRGHLGTWFLDGLFRRLDRLSDELNGVRTHADLFHVSQCVGAIEPCLDDLERRLLFAREELEEPGVRHDSYWERIFNWFGM